MPENLNPTNVPESPRAEPGEPNAAAKGPAPGIGLCFSGGGYRAMLFHLGSLWRLNELGLLPKLQRVSSVSGGSITAAFLAICWEQLGFQQNNVGQAARLPAEPNASEPLALRVEQKNVSDQFADAVVKPIRELARHTIDVGSVIGGLLNPFTSISDNVCQAYREYLFGEKTLQDLPDPPAPRFVINATNVQTGALWRFSKPFMGDFRVGLVMNPKIGLDLAVTASSAFPPFLSPVQMTLSGEDFSADEIADLQRPPFTTEVVLTDGGVYDNLGLETVFKRYDTVLVSDAGGAVAPEPEPHGDWARHSYRVLNLIDNQVRSLRKRILIAAYTNRSGDPQSSRKGAYWGIRTDIANYALADAMNEQCPHAKTLALADVPTRLESMEDELQERLINWGYAVCDAAMRKHAPAILGAGPAPPRFPYERGV